MRKDKDTNNENKDINIEEKKGFKDRFSKLNKKTIVSISTSLFLGMILGTSCASAPPPTSTEKPTGCYDKTHASLETQKENLEEQLNNKDATIDKLELKVKEADPWFKMSDAEKQKIEDENARIEAEKKAAKEAEEAKKEEEARLEAEKKEKQGYDTGITYDDLARNPENYIGSKVKFNGEVVQVMESEGYVELRIAVNGDYDKMLYACYTSNIVSSRVLEGDNITIFGMSSDLLTYTSTLGAEITIPSVIVEKIN